MTFHDIQGGMWRVYICKQQRGAPTEKHAAYGIGLRARSLILQPNTMNNR
jgi:hypothetical protein